MLKGNFFKKGTLVSMFFLLLTWQSNVNAQTTNNNVVTAVLPAIIDTLILRDEAVCRSAEANPIDGNEGNFVITSQENLDELQGVTRVTDIRFSNVVGELDFSPLDSLVEVTGIVNFIGLPVTSIDGLNCLVRAQRVFIEDNPNLVSVSGFESLTTTTLVPSVGTINALEGFTILNNPNLESVNGFESLTSVGAGFRLTGNDKLVNFPQFQSLQSVGGFLFVSGNNSILSIPEFQSLRTVGNLLGVSGNDSLVDVTAFQSLISTQDSLRFADNNSLESIADFSSLTSINGSISAGSIGFFNNPALIALPQFPVLNTVVGGINIDNNDSLTSLSDFPMLLDHGQPGITVSGNDSLVDLNGFIGLTTLALDLEENSSLSSISGFNSVSSARRLSIVGNDTLNDLSGFDNISTISALTIQENIQLQEISGFNNVNRGVQNNISIRIIGNPNLVEISGLNDLEGGIVLRVSENARLELISGINADIGSIILDAEINDNVEFDCTGQILNLIPLRASSGNEIDCLFFDFGGNPM